VIYRIQKAVPPVLSIPQTVKEEKEEREALDALPA